MTVTIVGSQLGDEGKGGIVDVYGDAVDVVVRYQGGDNAGHTVVHEGDEYKLSLVPSGAVRGKVGVLGNGCVVNPETLFEELDALRERGLTPDVRVAERAHAILPYHRVLDGIEEDVKSDDDLAAGTTGRGIGPTYEDKAGRRGVRIGDLLDAETLRARLEYVVPQKRALVEDVYNLEIGDDIDADAFDVEALFEQYREFGRRLDEEGMTVNCGEFLNEHLDNGDEIMFEGAQGTSIDIDHGIYPYVTSSNPTAGAAAVGTGVGPTVVGRGEVVGIVKAYLSRVGTGPLPTELGSVDGQTPNNGGRPDESDLATYIRDEGGEYGTVTGRPRRVGWLDMPMLRHAARANGFTGLAVNHLDVLAGLEEVKVGHAYTLDGEQLLTMPATTEQWADCEAEFRSFDGWPDVDWGAVADEGYEALPENARTYLDYIADELDAPIYAVGVGPGREETVVVESPL
ncbi:adenylosuccinate synthase [Natronomonas pharaonis DSM 2160]|uniref:Adenylosuccinate synthetase n=1 Tax=Natronomonas pharaonis (strain ATCC 35678 / DSM 2160 / CIP 103997 / JCM 8858 / NBRC 14720 / NCIMB 2260 / Gabara) TaxID=348780 RepID=PURA_NATPD|nr:adenylosuccinate synthase [Natronomonas pharaonis]Q3ISN0.1 RecName: Full=Adenylosuccinate synthetase; Short=AMPSase; Short=AdSS; AltName: Full=IMP--aspartate ligase [Natronomonas pharaonis DSM 2160]CAI48856.1 adenylosuccinate synthase [Natronomonas pharaonis DSM 2160]